MDDHKISGNLPLDAVTVALIAKDVEIVKSTTEDIKKQMGDFIKVADTKFESYSRQLATHEAVQKSLRHDLNKTVLKVDDVPNFIYRSINSHQKNCAASEVTVRKMALPSRIPKDTPREIKRPSLDNSDYLIPRWVIWTSIILGLAVTVALISASKLFDIFSKAF